MNEFPKIVLEDYCANCEFFDPDYRHGTIQVDKKNFVSINEVRCESAKKCRNLVRNLEKRLKNSADKS